MRGLLRVPRDGSASQGEHLGPRLRSRRGLTTSAPKVGIFCSRLAVPGGAERLAFEEAHRLKELGYDTQLATLTFDPTANFGAYDTPVKVLGSHARYRRRGRIAGFLAAVLSLAAWIRRYRPGLVIAMSATDSAYLRLPCMVFGVPYLTHINGSMFWMPGDRTRYAALHRGALRRVLAISPTHSRFVRAHLEPVSLGERLMIEAAALVHWWGVRGARERLTFSRRMAWEVELAYGRPARTIKGAYPSSLLDHRPASDPLAPYRSGGGPIILNVNRLDQRKRVDLAIDAFSSVAGLYPKAQLVIGGAGPAEPSLRARAAQSPAADRIHFVGFIPEDELPDWLGGCDVFVHPNWAEFAIAPFEALAVGRKVVWANEMEVDAQLDQIGLVFSAEPTPDDFAKQLGNALRSPSPDLARVREIMQSYTWERYTEQLAMLVRHNGRWGEALEPGSVDQDP